MKQPLSQASKRTNGTPLHLSRALLLAGVLLSVYAAPVARAAYLQPSGSTSPNDWFGYSVAISGETVYVGAPLDDDLGNSSGTVFVYHNISTATGTVTQSAKLYATGEVEDDQFGYAVSLSGTNALVTAAQDDYGRGAGWAIFDINAATPAQVRLAPPAPPYVSRRLGASASLSGNTALIGTNSYDSGQVGEAYLYRNIDTTPVQTRLTSPEVLASGDRYGASVALAGDIALVGAPYLLSTGAVFMYRNLASATPVETKIQAFDTDGNDTFGWSLSISGTTALVGARSSGAGYGEGGGAAYVIRNLDTTQVQTKLVASDAQLSDQFGFAVSLSGNTALVGANGDDGVDDLIPSAGAAYLFFHVDAGGANATATEDLKIFASNSVISAYGDKFGSSVAIDGDNFVVGAYSRNDGRGAAFTGSVSSMTTLDVGNATRSVDAISFISRGDWIIGQTTDSNTVQLFAGNTANVTSASKAVYIGKNAGSDNNTLIVSGTLTANQIHVGSAANQGNKLQIGNGGTTGAVTGDIINYGNVIFDRSNDYGFSEIISGDGGVTQRGSGKTTLSATNTYTGNTLITGGTLVVDGSIAGGATVQSDGTLGGSGTIGGAVTVQSGGTLSPGNSPGQITLLNNLTMESGSFLSIELGGDTDGTYDQLDVQGVFTAGGTLNLILVNAYVPIEGATFTIFNGLTPGFDGGSFTIATNLADGLAWDTSNLASQGVVSVVAAIPEPSTAALMMLGGIALLVQRRRKSR